MIKRSVLFIIALIFSISVPTIKAQVKVLSNGNFGIGVTNPVTKLDVYGTSVNFDYTNRPFCIALYCFDPRVQSNERVVFYKIDNSGYLDIECRQVFQNSDSLKKEKIEPVSNSLEKVKKLKGYTFEWKDDPSNRKNAGLLAQQVEKVIPEVVTTIDSTNEKLISYTGLVPYLVEAIKEQQLIIDAQSLKIKEFENRVMSLENKSSINLKKSQIDQPSYVASDNIAINAYLFQNAPNPFNESTIIKYFIPEGAQSASLLLFDLQGSLIKTIVIYQRGNERITINASELKPGMYFYTLVVDGTEVDTKRMILTD